MKRLKLILIAATFTGVAVGVLYLRYSWRLAHDTFNNHLAGLAGTDAASFTQRDQRQQSRDSANAFAAGKPFWTRRECRYGSERFVSEALVFTSGHELFQFDRVPPTFFRPAQIIKYRVNNPTIAARVAGAPPYLAFDNKTRLETYTLDP